MQDCHVLQNTCNRLYSQLLPVNIRPAVEAGMPFSCCAPFMAADRRLAVPFAPNDIALVVLSIGWGPGASASAPFCDISPLGPVSGKCILLDHDLWLDHMVKSALQYEWHRPNTPKYSTFHDVLFTFSHNTFKWHPLHEALHYLYCHSLA